MHRLKHSIVLLSAVLLVLLAAPRAHANQWNGVTYITFSGPVTLPGVTLPAGTYLFKHLEPGLLPHRHVVQVFSKDGTELYATLLAVPDYRLHAHGKPVIVFGESPANQPEAIKAWFYPGDHSGDEFVYPKAEAMRLAMASHTNVLTSATVPEYASKATAHASREIVRLRQAKVTATNGRGTMEAVNSTSATEVPPVHAATMSTRATELASLPRGGSTADDDTYLTFSAPVSLPGLVLPAGTYLFRHLPPGLTSHRHVVQVLAPDHSEIYATLLAIPDQRLKPSGKPVVVFRETPANQPEAIKAWFYPGDRTGDEFVYPRSQAMKLAMVNHENVLASSAISLNASSSKAAAAVESLQHASVSAVNGQGKKEAANTTSPAEVPPTSTVTMSKTPAPPAMASAASSPTPMPPSMQIAKSAQPVVMPAKDLPQTASLLPLIGLIAIGAPVGAFGVRFARRRLSPRS